MPTLNFNEGNSQKQVNITPLPFSLGRLPENQLVVPDPKVSRYHCQIVQKSGRYYLVDLGSANGTFVNRQRITEKLLENNDVISIGDMKLVYKEELSMDQVLPPEVLKPLQNIRNLHRGTLPRPDTSSQVLLILYQVARSIACGAAMKDVIDMALTLILQTMNAERGSVLILQGQNLVPFVTKSGEHMKKRQPQEIPVSMTIARRVITEKSAIITSDARYDPRFASGDSITNFGIRSALCVPLWEEDRITGAIYLDSSLSTHAFTEQDLDALTTISNIIAIGLKQEQLKEDIKLEAILRNNLERFLSHEVVEMIMKKSREQDIIPLEVNERTATIVFVDIINFTSLSERLSPKEVAELLNGFFTRMSAVIFHYEGSVNKFIGDALMAIFGAPIAHENDAELAVRAALDMLKESENFNRNIGEHKRFSIKIGINTGKVVAGNIGSTNRMEYTVLGDAVNIASRLQSSAKPNQILIGDDTYRLVYRLFSTRPLGMISLKGKTHTIQIHEVLGASSQQQPRKLSQFL